MTDHRGKPLRGSSPGGNGSDRFRAGTPRLDRRPGRRAPRKRSLHPRPAGKPASVQAERRRADSAFTLRGALSSPYLGRRLDHPAAGLRTLLSAQGVPGYLFAGSLLQRAQLCAGLPSRPQRVLRFGNRNGIRHGSLRVQPGRRVLHPR